MIVCFSTECFIKLRSSFSFLEKGSKSKIITVGSLGNTYRYWWGKPLHQNSSSSSVCHQSPQVSRPHSKGDHHLRNKRFKNNSLHRTQFYNTKFHRSSGRSTHTPPHISDIHSKSSHLVPILPNPLILTNLLLI